MEHTRAADPPGVVPCPRCGEPLSEAGTFCFDCRWRLGDPVGSAVAPDDAATRSERPVTAGPAPPSDAVEPQPEPVPPGPIESPAERVRRVALPAIVALVVVVASGLPFAVFRQLRGPSGTSAETGGATGAPVVTQQPVSAPVADPEPPSPTPESSPGPVARSAAVPPQEEPPPPPPAAPEPGTYPLGSITRSR